MRPETKNEERGMAATKMRLTPRRSIAVVIVFSTFIMFFVIAIVVAFISYDMYKDAFYEYSNQLCLQGNAQAAYVIDGDAVGHYAQTLQKDEGYDEFVAQMDDLRDRMGARYLYIMADTGVPGMYTYIYDGMDEDGNRYTLGDTESKIQYQGAAEVLATGEGFTSARYYNDSYGELYYAYAPITDSEGNVVAFVGNDIDMAPLHSSLQRYRVVIVVTVLLTVVCLLGLYFLLINRVLLMPMRHITHEAKKMSRGDLKLQLPPGTTARQDEIGQLANAFETVGSSVQAMGGDIENIMLAARRGYLWERADVTKYEGDYYRIIAGVNTALDVVCWHFDAVPQAIAILGNNCALRYSNRAMDSFLDVHKLDPAKEHFLARLVSGNTSDTLDPWVKLLLTGDKLQPFTRDISLLTEGGKQRTYNLSILRTLGGQQFNDGPEEEHSIMLMLNDVTTLVNALENAQQANNAKTEFLSRMSHEIRTPMNAIIGMAQIAKSTDDAYKIQNSLDKIETSSTHLLGIINDILDLSKIEAGKLVLNKEVISLADDMDFVLSMMKPRAEARNIKLSLRIAHIAHDTIETDSLRLNQVLINLLGNAIKFSPEGGNVRLVMEELGRKGEEATYRFEVEDDGIGIDSRNLARLFQPFEQADAGVAKGYGGTGLGLAISKRIVELMDGEIGAESVLGAGSTFRFTIQARICTDVEMEEKRNNEQAQPVDFANRRALVVDDIEINREIVLELLRNTGLMMETAADGKQAVEMFNNSAPGYYDILLMDMQMPEMDGCDATRAIRALPRPDATMVPIVAMTANVMQEDIQRALASGMDAHVGKPIDVMELEQVMQEQLAK